MQRQYNIALVGNPNSGKSSLFNALTGLNQKVGNFPGVTVDKKTGVAQISGNLSAEIIDLPGTYSLYPKSADEQVTYEVLLNQASIDRPDLIIVIADASSLKRNLLFCSQIIDLKIPVIISLSMMDIAEKKGMTIDLRKLQELMKVPVLSINPRENIGIEELKNSITYFHDHTPPLAPDFVPITCFSHEQLEEIKSLSTTASDYGALHVACNFNSLRFINAAQRMRIAALLGEAGFQKTIMQGAEITERYKKIDTIISQCVTTEKPKNKMEMADKIDRVLLHPVWGNLILLSVLFVLFQSIFWLAKFPMNWVEQGFAYLGNQLDILLPHSLIKDLIINGLLAGLSGIAVFVPQIMILFGFITILEDSGYMARISFLTDRIMRSAGLNGRSVMPLISGMACAVPAIMAARTIQNPKERLITILITPLMSCSARLPVYTMLIALVIPSRNVFGIFNLQGLVLMGLYLLGFMMALTIAKLLTWFIKAKEQTFFLMELPVYRMPRWKNVGITMIEKGKIFIRDVGKIIVIISLFLWALASFGPPAKMRSVEGKYAKYNFADKTLTGQAKTEQANMSHQYASEKLENSFAGIMGHAIEPIIRPLGFDWKIGIALITSFAAREVFVGTMATLYSVGDAENGNETLRSKMEQARNADGFPVYSLAVGLSLLIFYVFAMQCMSTLAVVKRETRSWKYPIFQFSYMFALAYFSAMLVYHLVR